MQLLRPFTSRAVLLFCSSLTLLTLAAHAQSTQQPQWQIEAGGKSSFEVASVKLNKSGDREMNDNFPLNLGPNFGQVGSLFSVTNVQLSTLIGFAYKLSVGQTHFLMPGLPSWVNDARFDINARAAIANPTKDQFRLMLQSLLADRFRLTMHRETRQLPIFEVVLSKPGKTGPTLTSHVDDTKMRRRRPVGCSPGARRFVSISVWRNHNRCTFPYRRPHQSRRAQHIHGLPCSILERNGLPRTGL